VNLIEIEDLTFSYTSQHEPALRNLGCTIEQGSFVGITGLAEAGKSSFCRLISGYIPHFFHGELSGTVSVAGTGTRETTIGELAARVGFVFENPFDQLTGASLTVLEEVAFALENMGLAREEIRPRAQKSLSQVGIEDLMDRHPQQLSGRQSQRLALASVLATQPEVFILDEPTSQLDPLGAEEVFEVISDLHRRGYTIILVSQDLDHLATRADRLIVIHEGEIRWDGEPRKVLLEAAEARYSERKRVATASVIAMNTPVVVLNEPTGGQDAEGIELLGNLVVHLVQQGKLVIVVSHDVRFAARHADRVIALHQGRILLDDDPRTVFGQDEALARTHVESPAVTRLGKLLGLGETLLSPEELLAVFAPE